MVARIERGIERLRRTLDQRQLLLLLVGNECRQRHHARNLRQRPQLGGDLIGRRQRRLQRLDIVGAAVLVLLELKIGRDQFDVAIAQVHRIEIEPQPIKQRRRAENDERGDDEDRHAMALEEIVDRREECVAERVRLAARLEQAQQRRQQSDAGEERDQHAEAGDQSELGQPPVLRRQEREKARRGGERRERQRRAGAPAGMQQRLVQTVDFVPLGPIADAELDSEIDAEADEQHGEIHRYQVERADHQHAERRRDRKSDDKADEHRENDSPPAQRHPQDEEHDGNGHDGVERRVVFDRGELVVVHRHRAGQAHARLISGCKVEVRGGLPDGVARLQPRLKLGIVEHGLDFQEPQQIGGFRLVTLDQHLPGKARRLICIHLVERVGRERHRPSHVVELDLAALHAEEPVLQRADHAAQARVGRQAPAPGAVPATAYSSAARAARLARTKDRSAQRTSRPAAPRWSGRNSSAAIAALPARRWPPPPAPASARQPPQ